MDCAVIAVLLSPRVSTNTDEEVKPTSPPSLPTPASPPKPTETPPDPTPATLPEALTLKAPLPPPPPTAWAKIPNESSPRVVTFPSTVA